MAEVAITMKIMPTEVDIDMKKLAEESVAVIRKFGKLYRMTIEPVAFGLNVLKTLFIIPEEGGGTEPIEAALKKIPGVSETEVTEVTRVS